MAFGLMHGMPTSLYAARSIRTFSVSRHPASGPIPCPSDDEIRLSALWFFVPGDLLGVGPAGYNARRGDLDESLAQAAAGMSGANLVQECLALTCLHKSQVVGGEPINRSPHPVSSKF